MNRVEGQTLSFHPVPDAVAETIKFGTKAETLERLKSRLTTAVVLDQLRFTASQWGSARSEVLAKIESLGFNKLPLIVRSSARSEDQTNSSLAGHFLSVLNVEGETAFIEAVDRVFASYGDSAFDEQILVQPMVANVVASGVAFSIDPNTGSPYLVINYGEGSDTAEITSGHKNTRSMYCFKDADVSALPELIRNLVSLIRELEILFGTDRIDIEFALDAFNVLYLLQCRPLVYSGIVPSTADLRPYLQEIESKVKSLSQPHPYLLGSKTIFGIMPDWNPAEIVGVRPKPLALSMYQELITDNIWAYQRSNYGYRNLRSFPLIVSLCGLPYVDVRVDFNSFVPADVDHALGDKLVNYYLNKLADSPAHHDKVEFEIVYTCYTFDLPERIKALTASGFDDEECNVLTGSLRCLTNHIMHEKDGLWKKDIEKIAELEERLNTISGSDLDTVSKIYWQIEDCKRYGTLPFAGLARAGFVAVQMLKSLVSKGVLSHGEYDSFMSSLNSVSSQMQRDFQGLSRSAFLTRYGHLRPGTYDILSPRYDEEPDRYFDFSQQGCSDAHKDKDFVLSLGQLRSIERLLDAHELDSDVLGFFDFIRASIEGREFSKFVFTRSLSDTLSLFKKLGAENGFTAEDCSFADIRCIKSLYASSNNVKATLRDTIKQGKSRYDTTLKLRLPSVVFKPSDVWSFEVLPSEPNFITQKSVEGPVRFSVGDASQLNNSVVFIPSADPGFDWIFSHGVKALVTMYGGVNSHMAIRAGELGIPAVIGVGELLFEQWSQASMLRIDCANRQVIKIK